MLIWRHWRLRNVDPATTLIADLCMTYCHISTLTEHHLLSSQYFDEKLENISNIASHCTLDQLDLVFFNGQSLSLWLRQMAHSGIFEYFDSGFICSHRVDGLELWSCNQSLADDCGSHLLQFWWSEWVELVLVKYGFLSFPCHQQSIAAEHCQQQTHVKQLLTKYKPITATVHMSTILTTRINLRLVSSHLLTLKASASESASKADRTLQNRFYSHNLIH